MADTEPQAEEQSRGQQEESTAETPGETETQGQPTAKKTDNEDSPRDQTDSSTQQTHKEQAAEEKPQADEPKQEAPKKEEPTEEEPEEEEPEKEEPKKEEPKKEAPKKEEPKKEAPKKEEPKKEPAKEQTRPAKPEPKKEEKKTKLPSEKGTMTTTDSRRPVDSRGDSKSGMEKSDSSEVRNRVKREFFKEELRRLQGSLSRESTKITPPTKKKHRPFVFNTLEPYYNTYTTSFLIDMPDESEAVYTLSSSRSTAQGLTDPWVNLLMDQEILPRISAPRGDVKTKSSKSKSKKAAQEPSRKEGSTRLPKFPVVAVETKDLATRQLYYSDVPNLRRKLRAKHDTQAKQRVDSDYRRTQQDFYRMDLDRMDQVAPGSRRHLTSTYMAYLQNTPGSRRAVSECVRTLEGQVH